MNYALITLTVSAALPIGSPRPAQGQTAIVERSDILWCVDWSPDGSQFAVGGVNTFWLFDAKTFKKKSLLPGQTEGYTASNLAWHPEGKLLAVSDQDGKWSGIYDTVSGNRVPLDADAARGVAWNSNRLAMTSAGDGHLRIWTSAGRLLHDVPRHGEAVGLTGLARRPSGDKIVTIGKYITLHDAQGKVIKQISHRPEAAERLCLLLCVEWHPAGEFFVVGDYGNEVDDPVLQFWSADGELLKSITIEGGAEIRNVSWNSEGSLLASASDALRIWTRTGELKHQGKSPDLLWGVDWHPDGGRILTSSMTGHVTMWDPLAEVVKRIVVPLDSTPPSSD